MSARTSKAANKREAHGGKGIGLGAAASPIRDFESQGERRRQQLLDIASHLIVTEGLHALRIPRIAELAGCTRTLVYRYFGTRAEIMAAILRSFDEALESRIGAERIRAGLEALAHPEDDVQVAKARAFLAELATVAHEIGAAGTMLVGTPLLRNELEDHAEEVLRTMEARWIRPLLGIGLSPLQAQMFWECANALTRMQLLNDERFSPVTEVEDDEVRIVLSSVLCSLLGKSTK